MKEKKLIKSTLMYKIADSVHSFFSLTYQANKPSFLNLLK